MCFSTYAVALEPATTNASSALSKNIKKQIEEQKQLYSLLKNQELSSESRYSIMKKIANNLLSLHNYNELIIFLTDHVERYPEDNYNAYWLFMTAYAYLENNAEPIAEYYFDRIINNYNDLIIKGDNGKNFSIHFLCLQKLILISTNPTNRIIYFNMLINKFPSEISIAEIYDRLAQEYEKEGEWEQAIKAYKLFLAQDDAASVQISGQPEAYSKAKQLIDFDQSDKDWTFDSLEALENAVKTAISRYDYKALDRYKSKVNFFAMSWRQDENDANSQENFSMRGFMQGNKIHYNETLDESSTPTEAYLRTWGWSIYINVWYLYFRKVNFPADPDKHGSWEWAGIYFGEKL
ncbi:MAG: tetratricopeptide repeat protein [Treponema sp.]|nr:tetratricopeptide repeat protein [Treponema sp.]